MSFCTACGAHGRLRRLCPTRVGKFSVRLHSLGLGNVGGWRRRLGACRKRDTPTDLGDRRLGCAGVLHHSRRLPQARADLDELAPVNWALVAGQASAVPGGGSFPWLVSGGLFERCGRASLARDRYGDRNSGRGVVWRERRTSPVVGSWDTQDQACDRDHAGEPVVRRVVGDGPRR